MEIEHCSAGLERRKSRPPMAEAVPTSSRRDIHPILHRWALLVPSNHRLLATPDAPAIVLAGVVRGDPRFPDGAAVVTSCLLELDPLRGFARTRTTSYRLGRPSRLFLRWLDDLGYAIDAFIRLAPGPARPGRVAAPRETAPSTPTGAACRAGPGARGSFDPG